MISFSSIVIERVSGMSSESLRYIKLSGTTQYSISSSCGGRRRKDSINRAYRVISKFNRSSIHSYELRCWLCDLYSELAFCNAYDMSNVMY